MDTMDFFVCADNGQFTPAIILQNQTFINRTDVRLAKSEVTLNNFNLQWRGWNALMYSVAHKNTEVFDEILKIPNIALDTATTVSVSTPFQN